MKFFFRTKFKKSKQFLLPILLLTFISVAHNAKANVNEVNNSLQQAIKAINTKNWVASENIINDLKEKYPTKQVLNNLMAIILFNQGKIALAQELLIEVIESDNEAKIAYKNLKKIYSYSAAKTYSQGLQLLTPVKLPELMVSNNSLNLKLEGVKTNNKDVLEEKDNFKISKVDKEKIAIKVLENWRKSWQQGHYKKYIANYSMDYMGTKETRLEWLSDRKRKVIPSKKIKVFISQVNIEIKQKQIITDFQQRYSSRNYSDKVFKRIVWELQGKTWKIIKETTLEVLN